MLRLPLFRGRAKGTIEGTGGSVPLAFLIVLLASWLQAPAAKPAAFFKTPLSVEEMTHKQAVVNTSAGTFVIDLRPDLAPNHVGYFMKLAKEGAYNGTTFHRVIK
jgi:hypothetical protein